ncbi:Uncharacterised protein [Mycobacteroides abscessus]|nr:Uncharacterised protein [Mycobacteroides abscessus]
MVIRVCRAAPLTRTSSCRMPRSSSRTAGSRFGAGAISMTFW